MDGAPTSTWPTVGPSRGVVKRGCSDATFDLPMRCSKWLVPERAASPPCCVHDAATYGGNGGAGGGDGGAGGGDGDGGSGGDGGVKGISRT